MNEDKYAKQEGQQRTNYDLAAAVRSNIEKVQIRGFLKGNLFSMLNPKYQSFRDLEVNQDN